MSVNELQTLGEPAQSVSHEQEVAAITLSLHGIVLSLLDEADGIVLQ